MNKETKAGRLYLIPTLLGDVAPASVLPASVFNVVNRVRHYIAEDLRSARRFLKKAGIPVQFDNVKFYLLNKYTDDEELQNFLSGAARGYDTGLLSEAGMPCIADPGSRIVAMAHDSGIRVVPLTGPSSIMLALMSSGLTGQSFVFHGYLPVKPDGRNQAIRKLEADSIEHSQSQIFMETPYRNKKVLESVISVCKPSTRLCIACDITLASEYILTRRVSDWQKDIPDIHKRPAIFIIQGER
ncbi:MAG: SAM-dependent methyltransferase [Marinilabiliales bacterium]|nr:MAG: SAM-dependent methyltransferase [Marinilabiliales bacterium]